jgi:hypothetical protein
MLDPFPDAGREKCLKGEENAPANGRRILERFQARRERLPRIVAEIGVPRAGRQHERVVAKRRA